MKQQQQPPLTNKELEQLRLIINIRVIKPNTTNDAGALANGQWWSPYSS